MSGKLMTAAVLLVQSARLAAPLVRRAGPLPCASPPFGLAQPGRDPANGNPEGKGPEQVQEQRRLDNEARVAAAKGIEGEGDEITIDDSQSDEQYAKRNDQQAEDKLPPQAPLSSGFTP
jgi:hypothetical protein